MCEEGGVSIAYGSLLVLRAETASFLPFVSCPSNRRHTAEDSHKAFPVTWHSARYRYSHHKSDAQLLALHLNRCTLLRGCLRVLSSCPPQRRYTRPEPSMPINWTRRHAVSAVPQTVTQIFSSASSSGPAHFLRRLILGRPYVSTLKWWTRSPSGLPSSRTLSH